MDAEYITTKNKRDWELYSSEYMAKCHTEERLSEITSDPWSVFKEVVRTEIQKAFPNLKDLRVCVPSSGDNLAVLAFALLGAKVTSCDFSENQLSAAHRTAERLGIADNIRFVNDDTMRLSKIEDGSYSFVYTSNGVHVWLNDLGAMYRNIFRILKSGGIYIMCDVHPFRRLFDENMNIIKGYDSVGPFEDEYNINFHWRVGDFFNAIAGSGIRVNRIEELMSEDGNSPLPEFLFITGRKDIQ